MIGTNLHKPVSLRVLVFVMLASTFVRAQQSRAHTPINLVMTTGPGRIVIPAADSLRWQTVNLYDKGTRPVFQIKDMVTGIDISYVLFPNTTGSQAPGICRDDILNAAMRSMSPAAGLSDIKQVKKSDHPAINGVPLVMGSFFLASMAGANIEQQNVFGVSSSETACAEIHLSKPAYKPSDAQAFDTQISSFTFDPGYTPTPQDFFTLGTIFYRVMKSYDAAAAYYQRALDTLPTSAPLPFRRALIDQLSMSYGISGQLKLSRVVNEAAIQTDPDYPLYYYNLACADAEQGKAADAKLHLQQAFDRKANTLPGETLPDPTKDDSILKLKKDITFWEFVQALK